LIAMRRRIVLVGAMAIALACIAQAANAAPIEAERARTGQACQIRFADGRSVPAAQFLGDELKRMDR
jgi:hypothetical protein